MQIAQSLLVNSSLLMTRQGGFSLPTDISELHGWWDLSDTTTTTVDSGNLLSQVLDKSGNTNTLTASGTARPSYNAALHNSMPGVTGDNKSMASANSDAACTAETIFIACRVPNAANTLEIVLASSQNSNYGLVYRNDSTPFNFRWQTKGSIGNTQALLGVLDINSGSTNGKFKLLELVRDQSKNYIEVYENGLLMGRDTHTDGAADVQLMIGGQAGSRGFLDWLECARWSRALTASERQNVRDYFNTKWNLWTVPAALVGTHPFNIRAAIALGYTTAADFSESVDFWRLVGDSDAVGLAPKSTFTAAHIAAHSNLFIYDLQAAATTNTNWEALDSRDDAASNDLGNSQSTTGMNPSLSYLLNAETTRDVYNFKQGITGSKASEVWKAGTTPGASVQDLQVYDWEALGELVFQNDAFVIDHGTVIHLGPNDMQDAADYNTFAANYGALVDYCNSLSVSVNGAKVYCGEVFSTATNLQTGLPIVRAAIESVAASRSFAVFVDGPDAAGDLVDNTHPNAATYESMAAAIVAEMTA